ncbi:DUF659 domain-containing protein/Dimer_Tnp_hAT domain-containing protein, partial [Cephalotus follicularis]
VAHWVYDAFIHFNALQSPYFQPAIDAMVGIGRGFKGPSYHEIRVVLLKDCNKECQLLVETYRSNLEKNGFTIMVYGWTDNRQRTLINFLVYCPAGLTFIKSVDASDAVKDAPTLVNLFFEVAEWVGPSNVVHMVTDNVANYIASGRLLHERYDNIYWSPCAAHCLNLLLKDISSMPHMDYLVSRASQVTIFVYNHITLLSWLRKRSGWMEIVRPAMTRFVTCFIILKSIYDHKPDLQALVTSKHYTNHKVSRTSKGKSLSFTILDNKFWDDCLIAIKVAASIIKLLRIVDSDEKPSLWYVMKACLEQRWLLKICSITKKKKWYEPYTNLLKFRWDRHLRKNLHVVAYFLNPGFMYDSGIVEKMEIMQSMYDLFEKKSICKNGEAAMSEIKLFRERHGSFGQDIAIKLSNTMQPDEWWRLFGHSAPNLQKVSILLLIQISSSSGCELNWIVFERIHTNKRNRLEHQILNDLVFVTYNLRLK